MAREIPEIPAMVARQLSEHGPLYRATGAWLRRESPPFAATCARGTSDQAALFFKYLCETGPGLPVASVGPSMASVYGVTPRLSGALLLTVSQSGGSPDIAALQQAARAGGAMTLALLNVTDSPVGRGAGRVLPMAAGPERAVAATKSFAASLTAIAALIAAWQDDRGLANALDALPACLDRALDCDWSMAAEAMTGGHSLFTVARGPGLAVAGEAALKCKETCRLHAEACSAAELHHGPIALAGPAQAGTAQAGTAQAGTAQAGTARAGPGFIGLAFAARDAARTSVREAAAALRARQALVFIADPDDSGPHSLPVVAAPHPLLQPVCHIIPFYRLVETVARQRGQNPDAPPALRKVTETL